jgi:predicted PurR-regulated permease PerM
MQEFPAGESPPTKSAASSDAQPRPARGLRRFRARWLALLGATLLAMFVCWLMLQPFVDVLLWAIVLAIVFHPLHGWLLRRVRRPTAAAALSCLLVVAVILVPLSLVTVAVVNEARGTATYVQENADRLLDPHTRVYQFLRRYVVDLDAPLPNERTQGPPAPSTRPTTAMRGYLVEQLRSMSATIAGGTFIVVGGVLVTLLKVIFVLLTMFYLFRDGQRIRTILFESLPLERAQSQRIFDRTREVIGASVYGVLVIASIQAVLGEIGFIVVGLPSPLLWGVVMFFLSMIPIGSFLVWVPACLFLLLTGHWVWAIVLAAWCAGVVGMIDNVLRPRLVGKRTRLHELLVFFSVIGGLQVFGALGLVVGPVVVAITLALIDIFRKADRPSSPAEPTLAEQQAALRNVEPEDGPAVGPRSAGTADAAVVVARPQPSAGPLHVRDPEGAATVRE